MSKYVERVDQRWPLLLALLQTDGPVALGTAWVAGYLDGQADVTEPGFDAEIGPRLDDTYLLGYAEGKKARAVETTPEEWVYRCTECGSDKVQHAHWVELNTETVLEPFGTWCGSLDNSYCAECEAHGRITYPGEE